ncbi:MAG TPA: hypothetical protein VME21_01330 [Steroidobacteraceae bacterium]|nr:hypothetical protein [Steroidobacteraceae bacterium]
MAILFAVYPWLEQWHRPAQPRLLRSLLGEALVALLVMLSALACDEAVRRGARVWRAFIAAMLCASALNVLAQWVLNATFGVNDQPRGLLGGMNAFFSVGAEWGTAVLVYVNRRSAQRLLARLRTGELERLQAERRLVSSRLAAAEARIDPAVVLRQLAEARNLYAVGGSGADEQLDHLIAQLRQSVARSVSSGPLQEGQA